MSGRRGWVREHERDPWVRRARAEGLRSRAAFKLAQIDDRDRILAPGRTVVDLGAAPGGWSQIAARRVAPGGRVVAVDLLAMEPLPGVETVLGDFTDEAVRARVVAALGGGRADLILSDMAPNLSGVKVADQARAEALAQAALELAGEVLADGGDLLVKVFHGPGHAAFLAALRAAFARVAVRKPEASRGRSAETYALARGRRAG